MVNSSGERNYYLPVDGSLNKSKELVFNIEFMFDFSMAFKKTVILIDITIWSRYHQIKLESIISYHKINLYCTIILKKLILK